MSKRYTKALVTDAIIDLRVQLSPETNIDVIRQVAESLKDTYPETQTIQSKTMAMEVDQEDNILQTESHSQQNGFRLTSSDKRLVVQLALDSFTFVHLKPYTDWLTFSTEAKRVWGIYNNICKVLYINRVGLRYINRLDIPETDDLTKYFALHPTIPIELPYHEVKGFFLQLQVPQHDIDSMLIINEAQIGSLPPNLSSYILDFDLFRERQWNSTESEEVWKFIATLRDRKNQIFEASITKLTRALMEEVEAN